MWKNNRVRTLKQKLVVMCWANKHGGEGMQSLPSTFSQDQYLRQKTQITVCTVTGYFRVGGKQNGKDKANTGYNQKKFGLVPQDPFSAEVGHSFSYGATRETLKVVKGRTDPPAALLNLYIYV